MRLVRTLGALDGRAIGGVVGECDLEELTARAERDAPGSLAQRVLTVAVRPDEDRPTPLQRQLALAEEVADIERRIVSDMRVPRVAASLASTGGLLAAALVMREIEEKSLPVIADELDVAEDSVKHLLYRARRGLRKLLAGTSVAPGTDAELTRGLRPVARSASGGAAGLLLLALLVPRVPADRGASGRTELRALKEPQVLLTALAGAIGFGGMFAVEQRLGEFHVPVAELAPDERVKPPAPRR